MHTVWVVEDDPEIRKHIAAALAPSYHIVPCGCLADAERELERGTPSLILLDVNLPDGDGFRFCAKLRANPSLVETAVIFLTSHSELSEKVMGLSLGADDYMTKPFEVMELRARVDARIRRITAAKERIDDIRISDLHLSAAFQRASVVAADGQELPVELTPLEFKLLFQLASREGEVLTREEIMKAAWGKNVHVTDRVVDTHVSNLRRKLSISALTISSSHGVGYKLCRREIASARKKAS